MYLLFMEPKHSLLCSYMPIMTLHPDTNPVQNPVVSFFQVLSKFLYAFLILTCVLYDLPISWSEQLFIGPEVACSISIGVDKKAIRGWTDRNHKKYWESITGLRQAKGFIAGPSARRTKDLLRLNRDQLRWVLGLLTRHYHLIGQLFKLGLTDNPTC